MNAAVKAMLVSNLKSMKLATMLKHLKEKLRQAKEGKLPYEEFLLNLYGGSKFPECPVVRVGLRQRP